MSQPAPAISARDLRPHRRWYFVALGIFLLFSVAGGIAFGVFFDKASEGIDLSVVSSSPQQVRIAQDETKAIYTTGEAVDFAVPECSGEGPGELSLSEATGTETYTNRDTTWTVAANVEVTKSGTYTVTCEATDGARLAIGNKIGGVLARGAAAFGLGFLGLGLGLVIGGTIAIVTVVRRSLHKGRLQRPAPAIPGPGGFGGPGAPPPPPPYR